MLHVDICHIASKQFQVVQLTYIFSVQSNVCNLMQILDAVFDKYKMKIN